MHFPTFEYAIRRMRISDISPLVPLLQGAGYKWEKDSYSDNTLVFEFPIDQGKTRSAETVSIWEQFSLLAMLQREFADNMVSATIYFDPVKEAHQLEYALAQYAPVIKSCSMLPHTEKGVYKQAPYEGITRQEYEKLLAAIKPIDWTKYCKPIEPEAPKYCSNDSCELPTK
jgi:ribonucleoside-diphosphate reductase alpha chain